MNSEIAFIISIIQKELWLRWKLALVLFVVTALGFLTAAWVWPKVFTSSSAVLVDQQSILSPLMQGTAVTTEVGNRSKIARQVMFSQRAMEQIIASEVWAGENFKFLTPLEIERLKNEIQDKADVTDVGQNLIEISFKDADPKKAFVTASLLTDIFIQESINAKQVESKGAYDFIDEQVSIYQGKLRLAEEAIKEFRSKNVDATEGAKLNANQRLVELKRESEAVELDLSSEKSSILGNKKQLAGEVNAATNASFVKENELQLRIVDLNKRLDELRLNYKETYPDIVQLKGQIVSLRKGLIDEASKRNIARKAGTKKAPTGIIAQDLKRSILVSESNVVSLTSKYKQLLKLMERERKTLTDINSVEAEVAELNRDYTVNQTMYQDLLAQREKARVSMNMDIKNQGLTMKIQDPALLPQVPKGVRFLHIILAGLILSFVIPIVLIYGIILIDQKVRNEAYLRDELRLPILAAVYLTTNKADFKKNVMKFSVIATVVFLTWSIYSYAIILKIQG